MVRLSRGLLAGVAATVIACPGLLSATTYSLEQDVNPRSGAWQVCVVQSNSCGDIAGVQMNMVWDPQCMTSPGPRPRCESNPDTRKTVQAALKSDSELKAIFLSFSDVDPIPDGWLFCCDFDLADPESRTGCPVRLEQVIAASAEGQRMELDASCDAASNGGSGSGCAVIAGEARPLSLILGLATLCLVRRFRRRQPFWRSTRAAMTQPSSS